MENKYLDYEGFEHTIERLRRKEMPEPGLDYVGQIVQYVGNTSADYVKGNFYECVSETEEGVTTYRWELKETGSISFYDKAIGYGYRHNEERELYQSLMDSVGNLANNMLGEVIGTKYEIGPANNNMKWVNDSLVCDSEENCLYWGGPDPSTPDTKDKIAICKLDLSTGEVTSALLNLPKATWADTQETTVRDIAIYKNYLYLAVRSSGTSKPSASTDLLGAIVCVNKSDLSVEWAEKMDARCSGVNVFEASNGITYLMLNGRMEYFKLYTVNASDPTSITLVETRYFRTYPLEVPSGSIKESDVDEQQKGCFYETDNGNVLYIGAGFGDGLRVWDVTNAPTTGHAVLAGNFQFKNHRDILPSSTYHTQDCVVGYPYVYATLGPDSSVARSDYNNGTNNRRMGLLTLDISDLSNITGSIQHISVDDMCDFMLSGDPKPKRILMQDDKLFLANGNKGVAIYDISTPDRPIYLGTKFLTEINDVDGLAIGGKYLYVGDCGIVRNGKSDLVYLTPKCIKKYEVYTGYKDMFAGGNTPEPVDDVYTVLGKIDIIEDFSDAPAGAVSVMDYGATADGVTDDSAAFIAAIASGSTYIKVPRGTYNMNHVEVTFPAGVTFIGESPKLSIIINSNITATLGITVKNIAFDGGTDRDIQTSGIIKGVHNVIMYNTPSVASPILLENCIFKNADVASWAVDSHENVPGFTSDVVRDCVFENLREGGVYHVVPGATALYENNIFRNLGDNTRTRYKMGIWAGDTSNSSKNPSNSVGDVTVRNNLFDTLVTPNRTDTSAQHNESGNFIAVLAEHIEVYNNVFKNIIGYGTDREGIYTKGVFVDIHDNYLENAGLGEGYICCKQATYLQSTAMKHKKVHNNVLVGDSGRGIVVYGDCEICNNHIYITNAKNAIVVTDYTNGKEDANIVDNNIKIGMAPFVVDGVTIENYHLWGSSFPEGVIRTQNTGRLTLERNFIQCINSLSEIIEGVNVQIPHKSIRCINNDIYSSGANDRSFYVYTTSSSGGQQLTDIIDFDFLVQDNKLNSADYSVYIDARVPNDVPKKYSLINNKFLQTPSTHSVYRITNGSNTGNSKLIFKSQAVESIPSHYIQANVDDIEIDDISWVYR